MAPIAVGDTLPEGTLYFLDDNNSSQKVSVHGLATRKKVVVFGIPGAFSTGCSTRHVPGFIEKSEELKAKGIDEIICICQNDPYVVKAWEKTFPANKHIKFLGDGSAAYARALGLEWDLTEHGGGVRSRRFALVADDLKLTVVNAEEGGDITVSTADDVLKAL